MDEGNFLMRLPPGFAEGKAEAPWLVRLAKDGATVRLRIDPVPADQLGLGAGELAAPRAAGLTLEGEGGARRLGTGKGEGGADRIALYVRDGKRFYEVVADVPADNADLKKALRAALENFTLLNPQGAPEPAPEDPDALKEKKLEHDFYKISVVKPRGFGERPPDVEGDRGIWTHLRRTDKDHNLCEIRIRSHLSLEFKKSVEELAAERLKQFGERYQDTRLPKRPKGWKVRGGKEGLQLQMSGRAPKTGVIVRADYRYVAHENGRTYEFEILMWNNASREYAKELKQFWRSLKLSGD